MSERLQKVLANSGFGSRREIECWIRDGRLEINGVKAKLGDRVGDKDQVSLDGKRVEIGLLPKHKKFTPQILLYHKPAGEVCARKDEKFRTVYESLPPCEMGRWIMVGRLDVSTTGLLLFTNDGDLANTLMHPSSEIPRKYLVRAHGLISRDKINRLRTGVMLSDGLAKFSQIKPLSKTGTNQWFEVVLKEGRNREVKRMFENQDCTVTRLMRIGFGPVDLPKSLLPGKWRYCDPNLKKQVFSALL